MKWLGLAYLQLECRGSVVKEWTMKAPWGPGSGAQCDAFY